MSAESYRIQTGVIPRAVHIPCGSVTLAGELSVPQEPIGLVIFARVAAGKTDPRLAAELFRLGFGTLVLDLLTPGEAADERTRGSLALNMGLLTQRLVVVAQWVAGEDEARHLRLGFLGTGTGCGAALVAAADLGRTIGAVACCDGRPDLAGNALRRVKAPTLLISGPSDEPTLGGFGEEALELIDCRKHHALLEETRGAERLVPGSLGPSARPAGTPSLAAEYARVAGEWFAEHLAPSGSARFLR